MSGHSKFANIKHKKEKNDAAKGKIFTVIGREIAVAVKEGGADPANNSKLRDVIAKAKANNVPNDTIDRGIKKAAGDVDSVNYEQNVYEGYGPSGVAIIVETLTDNKNRTAANVRAAFTKGGGNIGAQVIKNLTGFGCKILTYDVNVNKDILPYAEYVSLEDIYEKCDLISLHLPLLESTKHIINDESINKMKDNVIIVNCARGGLCDTKALIRGIESGKIGALGLDTMENEESFVHSNHKNDIIVNKDLFYLRQFRNVTITPHIAFYTDSAVFSMVKYSLEGLKNMAEGKKCVTEL